MKSRIALIFLICFCFFGNNFAQKHTFTNNIGYLKNYSSGELTESSDIDNITIENVGNGKYRFTDSKESILFEYSHMEKNMYVYKKVDGWAQLKCVQKLSLFAEGKPGKIILEINGAGFELRYMLNN